MGINVFGSTVGSVEKGGGIFNYGQITLATLPQTDPTADDYEKRGDAISVLDSTVNGGVLNAGKLVSGVTGNHGIYIGSTESVDRDGETEGKTHIVGDVVNSGSIVAGDMTVLDSEFDVDGIHVEAARIDGNLINSGTIAAEDDAIQLKGGYVDDDLFVDAKLTGSLVNTKDGKLTANDDAVDIEDAQIGGDIRNDGTIVAGDSGYEIYDLTLAGNFVNTGSISAQGDGVSIEDSTITGNFVNTGSISAQGDGVNIEYSTITGNFENTGSITAGGDGISIGEASTIGKLINNGSIVAAEKAIALYEGSTAAGVTIAGIGSKPAVLDGKQFALFAQGTTQKNIWECSDDSVCGEVTVDVPAASFGGIALAGNTRIVGDIYAQADALTVTGSDNRISGALDVKQLTVESGGVLVLDSLASSSKAWQPPAPEPGVRETEESGPTLADALKTSDGVSNNGRLVLAKAEAYKVIGNYSQAADATLAVRATGDDSYSKLLVDGTATLASGSKIAVDVRQDSEITAGATSSNTLFNTNRLAGVIQATNLDSDGKFTVSDNSALFDFGAEKSGNQVDLVLKRAGSTEPEPEPEQPKPELPKPEKKPIYLEQIVKDQQGDKPAFGQGAARVLDKVVDRLISSGSAGEMAPVITALGKLGTQMELAQAVEQLTPVLPSAALSAVSDSLGAINRVVQARVEGNIGLSSGDEVAAERYVWVKPFGSYAKQDARSETAGFKANTGGLVFGADAAISPKLRLGAALAYAHSDVDGKSASAPQSSKVDVYQLIGYGSVQLDARTEFNFQLDGGRNRNQGERQLSFMGLTAHSDYDSLSYHAGAGIGRTFALPREISTTPSLRVDYTRIKEDGYSETGAGAAGLINGKRSVEQTLLAVDNRVTLPLNARQSVSLNAGAAYDLMNDAAVLTSAFAGESSALFSTESSGQSRWLWRAGIGHTYKADTGKAGLELSTRLDGEWRKGGYSNATASVKARYAF